MRTEAMWAVPKWDWGTQSVKIPLEPTETDYSQAKSLVACYLLHWQRCISKTFICAVTWEMWLNYRWGWKRFYSWPGLCAGYKRAGGPIDVVHRGHLKFSSNSWMLWWFCPGWEVGFYWTLFTTLSRVCHIYFVCAFKLRGSFLDSFST